MTYKETNDIKIVPALCTQCGAKIEVNPAQDAAICPHCKTAFIVEKAVRNYHLQSIQNMNFEHINTVNFNTTHVNDSSAKNNTNVVARVFKFIFGVLGKMFFWWFVGIVLIILVAIWKR